MKKLVPISFTDKTAIKNKIIKLARDHGTNRSWMARLLIRYALTNMTAEEINEAVLDDLKSQARVIR